MKLSESNMAIFKNALKSKMPSCRILLGTLMSLTKSITQEGQ